MNDDLLRVVVIALSCIACLCIGGAVLVVSLGKEPPAALYVTIGTAVGALAGVLVPTRSK